MTTHAHELELEGKEVDQNPRWFNGLSSWLSRDWGGAVEIRSSILDL